MFSAVTLVSLQLEPALGERRGEHAPDALAHCALRLHPQARQPSTSSLSVLHSRPSDTPNSTKLREAVPMRRKISSRMPSSSFCDQTLKPCRSRRPGAP